MAIEYFNGYLWANHCYGILMEHFITGDEFIPWDSDWIARKSRMVKSRDNASVKSMA